MKGHQSIYQSLFAEAAPVQAALPIPERKGRSEALKTAQNEAIVARYYYYVKLHGRQYEVTLELLQAEMYLAKRTLINIIQENAHRLRLLNASKPDVKYFRTKYPHFNWSHQFQ